MSTEILLNLARFLKSAPDTAWKDAALGQRSGGHFTTYINPYSVHVARSFPHYLGMLKEMDQVLADGILMSKAASRIRTIAIGRFSFDGNSMAPSVFSYCADNQVAIALIGGVEGIASCASDVLKKSYPELDVRFTHSGFFLERIELERVLDSIMANQIGVTIVGMGAPHQEEFLIELRRAGYSGAAFTCGGYLDQLCQGDIAYYPALVERMNLRALYRLIKEPRRLGRRYLLDYVPFYRSAARSLLLRHRNPDRGNKE